MCILIFGSRVCMNTKLGFNIQNADFFNLYTVHQIKITQIIISGQIQLDSKNSQLSLAQLSKFQLMVITNSYIFIIFTLIVLRSFLVVQELMVKNHFHGHFKLSKMKRRRYHFLLHGFTHMSEEQSVVFLQQIITPSMHTAKCTVAFQDW